MTVLLIDIGNSRVKWARVTDGRMGAQHAADNSGWRVDDYARRVVGRWETHSRARASSAPRSDAGRIVVSSVAGTRIDRMLVAAARKRGAPAPEFFVSRRRAGGIVTAYLEPWRLGVDRFLGAIGAHHLAAGRAVCVVNIGTALTIDLVAADGQHLGGAIVPGPALMVESLLRETSGIRRRARGGASGAQTLFARSTRTAIREGSRYAAAAVIDRAVQEARGSLGRDPIVLLTGGGSAAVKPLVRSACIGVPNLVLVGLAVWAGQVPLGRALN